jgi:transcriptional regulator with XRE-family HTH domain
MEKLMDLRTARFFKKKTQADLFIETEIPMTRISMFERGLKMPSEMDRRRLAMALGMKPEEIDFSLRRKVSIESEIR